MKRRLSERGLNHDRARYPSTYQMSEMRERERADKMDFNLNPGVGEQIDGSPHSKDF